MRRAGPTPPGDGMVRLDVTRPKRRALGRVLAGAGIVLCLLLASAGVLYGFGGMERPSAQSRAAYERLVDSGQAPPIEARFRISIPGCVCHSDDPVLQAQHEYRYMRDCGSCHPR